MWHQKGKILKEGTKDCLSLFIYCGPTGNFCLEIGYQNY